MIGLNEVGAGSQLLGGCSIYFCSSLTEIEDEIVERNLRYDCRDLDHDVASRRQRLGKGIDDALVGKRRYACKHRIICTFSYPQVLSLLLGALPDDARAGIVVLGNIDQLCECVGMARVKLCDSIDWNRMSGTISSSARRGDYAGALGRGLPRPGMLVLAQGFSHLPQECTVTPLRA